MLFTKRLVDSFRQKTVVVDHLRRSKTTVFILDYILDYETHRQWSLTLGLRDSSTIILIFDSGTIGLLDHSLGLRDMVFSSGTIVLE